MKADDVAKVFGDPRASQNVSFILAAFGVLDVFPWVPGINEPLAAQIGRFASISASLGFWPHSAQRRGSSAQFHSKSTSRGTRRR